MTSINFEDLYTVAETGVASQAIPGGDYDSVVVRANPYPQSSIIFLELEVMNGPLQGKRSDVSIYFPKEGDKKGTQIYFAKKMGGFMGYPDVKAALLAARNAPSDDQALELIAGTLGEKQVRATLALREDGDYAGTNQLEATKRIGDAPVAAAPATAVAPNTTEVPEVGAEPAAVDPGF